MRAVVLKDFTSSALSVEEIPRPSLRAGQVLIKIAAAPINPSDLVFLRDQYGIKKKLPVVPGFEGAGTVVEAEAGMYGRWLLGKRVACRAPEDGNGTWAEFMAVDARAVIPLIKEVSLEEGASLLVNPFTAWALLNIVRKAGQKAFIQTAAASALGRMMERLGRQWNLVSINIVRRREQVELMKKEGAVHVLDTSEPGWQEQLKILADRYKARIAFDSVAGELPGQVAAAMAPGARVLVYGGLSGQNCQVSPHDLLFEGKRLEGFWVTAWIKNRSLLQNLLTAYHVQKLIGTALQTKVQARFPLAEVQEAIRLYKAKRIEGKVLLVP